MATDLRAGIVETAQALGMSPFDLATIISYETAGTFDPAKRGPTTQHGQHRGLIQFGEPQARKFGVDWNDPLGSQLGADGAVAKYMRDAGFKPGMGLLDAYSAVNAGRVGRYNASDANNGGAPGTVADKVNNQMSGHRRNAERLLGELQNMPADGPKGQESYPVFGGAPLPAIPTAVADSSGVPAAARAAANPAATGGTSDILGMMAMAQDQRPQFSPVQISGPSTSQANGLLQLVQALKGGMA